MLPHNALDLSPLRTVPFSGVRTSPNTLRGRIEVSCRRVKALIVADRQSWRSTVFKQIGRAILLSKHDYFGITKDVLLKDLRQSSIPKVFDRVWSLQRYK